MATSPPRPAAPPFAPPDTDAPFFQPGPEVPADTFAADPALRAWLRRTLPAEGYEAAAPALARLGARAGGDLLALADAAEREPPRHVPFDAWGRRVDRIETSAAWRALDRASAEEGIVATAYESAHGAYARPVQAALLYLFHPSSAVYSCPLAMTDGAARCLLAEGAADPRAGDPRLADAAARLTTRDPARFWTSGQWMTERAGGSDVSRTATRAEPAPASGDSLGGDGWFALHGFKWFTSATTSQMALTLARLPGAPAGSAGLSLFWVPLARRAEGCLTGIRVERLKDKLGTRALPTAELALEGAPARLVGGPGHGVRRIAAVLNVTRVYNAVCAAAGMRRAVMLARDYARRRHAFGRPLAEHPLHAETLAAMEVEARGALALVLDVAARLGREECGLAGDAERSALRLLTPVAKLCTGKWAVALASEAIEAFGGAGYVEDTGLPRLLRDAQVLAIWEGTTNVLALDVLRAIGRDDALRPLVADVGARLGGVRHPALAPSAARVRAALAEVAAYAERLAAAADRDAAEAGARAFAFALGRVTAGALLLEHAEWAAGAAGAAGADPAAVPAARRWCAGPLAGLVDAGAEHRGETAALVGEGR